MQRIQRLQQQRGFAYARVTADQHHPAFNDAAAQHAVQLLMAGGAAFDFIGLDIGQDRYLGGGAQGGETVPGLALLGGDTLNQAVPGAAGRALAQPLGTGAAAIGTHELGFFFGHDRMVLDI